MDFFDFLWTQLFNSFLDHIWVKLWRCMLVFGSWTLSRNELSAIQKKTFAWVRNLQQSQRFFNLVFAHCCTFITVILIMPVNFSFIHPIRQIYYLKKKLTWTTCSNPFSDFNNVKKFMSAQPNSTTYKEHIKSPLISKAWHSCNQNNINTFLISPFHKRCFKSLYTNEYLCSKTGGSKTMTSSSL